MKAERLGYWLNQQAKAMYLTMGYRLQKSPRIYRRQSPRRLLVECVGAPGTGKTTTLDFFYRHHRSGFERLRPGILGERVISQGPIEPCHFEIISTFLKLGMPNSSASNRLEVVNYARFEMLIRRLHESKFHLAMCGTVLQDEGLFKTFPSLMLSYLNEKSSRGLESVKNRAFLIFETDPSYQAELIINRKVSRTWSQDGKRDLKGKHDAAIEKRMAKYKESLATWEALKLHLKEGGVPFASVDPSNGVSLNSQTIRHFLDDIS